MQESNLESLLVESVVVSVVLCITQVYICFCHLVSVIGT